MGQKTNWKTYVKRSRKSYDEFVSEVASRKHEDVVKDMLGRGIVPPTAEEFAEMVKSKKLKKLKKLKKPKITRDPKAPARRRAKPEAKTKPVSK